MTNTADSEHATVGGGNVDSINALLRVPPFWPDDVELWFTMLEVQFATARITSDQERFQTAVAHLDKSHVRLIRDVVTAPPATGCYEFVKKELIKILGESDAKSLRHVIEKEQMGDRKPSQFYRDLRNLATNALADDFILTVWEDRLQPRVRSILASVQSKDPGTRIQIADSIFETTLETGQIVAASAARLPAATHPTGQNSGIGDPVATALNALNDRLTQMDSRMDQMQAQIAELRIDGHRRSRSQ